MLNQTMDTFAHTQFGIDEVYFHKGLDYNLLKKLQQRSGNTLDATDNIVQKHVTHDMVLIFYKRLPSNSFIYKYLKLIHEKLKQPYIESHTLLNEDELLDAIKSQNFVLVTHRNLSDA